jgi:hypothetical protein
MVRYVDYFERKIALLHHFGVLPYFVFDGDNLPMKMVVERDRARYVT